MPAMAMRRRLDFGSCSYLSGGGIRSEFRRRKEGRDTPDFVDKSMNLRFHVCSASSMAEGLAGKHCVGARFIK